MYQKEGLSDSTIWWNFVCQYESYPKEEEINAPPPHCRFMFVLGGSTSVERDPICINITPLFRHNIIVLVNYYVKNN
jgi:hypothetical protein